MPSNYANVLNTPVKELMTRYILMVEPDLRVLDAMNKMMEHNFRCIIVAQIDPYKELGLVTRFDIMEKVIGAGLNPVKVRVADVIGKPIVYIESEETIKKAARLMGENGICNLPVKKEGRVIGVISSSDIFRKYRKST
jgi:acetoin utilization protein AcuB